MYPAEASIVPGRVPLVRIGAPASVLSPRCGSARLPPGSRTPCGPPVHTPSAARALSPAAPTECVSSPGLARLRRPQGFSAAAPAGWTWCGSVTPICHAGITPSTPLASQGSSAHCEPQLPLTPRGVSLAVQAADVPHHAAKAGADCNQQANSCGAPQIVPSIEKDRQDPLQSMPRGAAVPIAGSRASSPTDKPQYARLQCARVRVVGSSGKDAICSSCRAFAATVGSVDCAPISRTGSPADVACQAPVTSLRLLHPKSRSQDAHGGSPSDMHCHVGHAFAGRVAERSRETEGCSSFGRARGRSGGSPSRVHFSRSDAHHEACGASIGTHALGRREITVPADAMLSKGARAVFTTGRPVSPTGGRPSSFMGKDDSQVSTVQASALVGRARSPQGGRPSLVETGNSSDTTTAASETKPQALESLAASARMLWATPKIAAGQTLFESRAVDVGPLDVSRTPARIRAVDAELAAKVLTYEGVDSSYPRSAPASPGDEFSHRAVPCTLPIFGCAGDEGTAAE